MTSVGCRQRADPPGAAPYPDDLLDGDEGRPPPPNGLARPDQLRCACRGGPARARPRPPQPGLPAPGRPRLGRRALRRPARASARPAADPAPRWSTASGQSTSTAGLEEVAPRARRCRPGTPVVYFQLSFFHGFARELSRATGIEIVRVIFALTGESREVGGIATNDVVSAVAQAQGSTAAQARPAWTLQRRQARTGHPEQRQRCTSRGAPRRRRSPPLQSGPQRVRGDHGARVIRKTWLVTWPPGQESVLVQAAQGLGDRRVRRRRRGPAPAT